jgi:hypothetical protein
MHVRKITASISEAKIFKSTKKLQYFKNTSKYQAALILQLPVRAVATKSMAVVATCGCHQKALYPEELEY